MNLVEVKKLIEIFNASGEIARLSIKQDNFELKLDKAASSSVVANAAASIATSVAAPVAPIVPVVQSTPESSAEPSNDVNGEFITSPMVGTFYHKPSPEAAPYVNVGDKVKKGQTIGIIEAMKIMNEIEAEFDCKIISIDTGDGQPVEYGSKLIKVERL